MTAALTRRSHATTVRPSATRSIPVRKLRTDPTTVELADDEWIVDGDPIFSHFLTILSAVFPKGEDFFVATVRDHRDAVADDPVLKAQVKGFIGQEAMHGREHRALNARLAEMGYNTVRADRLIGQIVDRIYRLPSKRLGIAVTAAAEHYTGTLAESVLGHEPTRTVLFGREEIEPLIAWHALEELEHKNVAFDVMVRAGGGYPVQVAGFVVTTGVLAGYVVLEWSRSVYADRHRITRRHRRTFLRNLGRQKLLSVWFLARVAAYLKPGFHPDDTDTDALVEEWRVRLADVATARASASES